MGATVKDASGSYGEFLRVDFTKDYGDLGANMQAVKWTYYGNDSTRSKALATYGTKFAADNWICKRTPLLDTEGFYLLAWLTPHQQRLVRAVAFRFARRRPVLPCLCKRADSLQKIMSFRD